MPKPLQVFNRHCYSSSASLGKARPPWFKRESCLANLLRTTEASLADIHFVYDAHEGDLSTHFLSGVPGVHLVDGGTEASSFLALLDYICSKQFPENTIVYIVEDDYLHLPGWCNVLLDGFNLDDAAYVTLYDHPDKYLPRYDQLSSRIRIGRYCHWRETPSTTNTFAARFGVLQQDLDVHRASATGVNTTRDHARFVTLSNERRRVLYSAIPAFSTHVENDQLAPLIDWERLSNAYAPAAKHPATDPLQPPR